MRIAIIASIVALLIGLGAGYLRWGERAQRAIDEADAMKTQQAQQADELRKHKLRLRFNRDEGPHITDFGGRSHVA